MVKEKFKNILIFTLGFYSYRANLEKEHKSVESAYKSRLNKWNKKAEHDWKGLQQPLGARGTQYRGIWHHVTRCKIKHFCPGMQEARYVPSTPR